MVTYNIIILKSKNFNNEMDQVFYISLFYIYVIKKSYCKNHKQHFHDNEQNNKINVLTCLLVLYIKYTYPKYLQGNQYFFRTNHFLTEISIKKTS